MVFLDEIFLQNDYLRELGAMIKKQCSRLRRTLMTPPDFEDWRREHHHVRRHTLGAGPGVGVRLRGTINEVAQLRF